MASIKPFAALRPSPGLAGRICELPYDVMTTEEARRTAAGNPVSFLHVSKPEIDLPTGTDPYSHEVYSKGRQNLESLISKGALVQDPAPAYYLYRQVMGTHSQIGVVAVASCQEYRDGAIKRHELTRPDKEADRVRHIETLNAQTGPVFLTYRGSTELDVLVSERSTADPDVDFVAADGVRHTSWTLRTPADTVAIKARFDRISALYIADGHHRCAAAARVWQGRGDDRASHFLAVLIPHDQVQILPYNRVVRDLNHHSPRELLARVESVCHVEPAAHAHPSLPHEVCLYLAGQWYSTRFRPELTNRPQPADRLDVSLLQQLLLEPILGISDPRTSERINFVGGIRGTRELELLVNGGEYACAFSLAPTRVEDLMAIADSGGIMPPKSTWFEPKLRDAMFCHLL